MTDEKKTPRFPGALPRPEGVNEVTWNQFQELAYNAFLSRRELLKSFMDPRRNIDEECGFPQTRNIDAGALKRLYERDPIAARVVELMPKEVWKYTPEVYETEDASVLTPFEQGWEQLNRSLRGASWYKSDEGSPIWEELKKLDIVSRIGRYGIMLIGLSTDTAEDSLAQPAAGIDENGMPTPQRPKGVQITYLRCFDEEAAPVVEWESNVNSRRFGQPKFYNVTFNSPLASENQSSTGIGAAQLTKRVHWSRVIHVARNTLTGIAFGMADLLQVYNNIYNLQKLYAGSAEMYWRGAFPGLAIETHPQLGGDVNVDTEGLRSDMEQYMNGLQRYFALMGMTAKSLAPQVVDPTPQIEAQLQAICIKLGVPKRIFMGSERGELSSAQDSEGWDETIQGEMRGHTTPQLIVQFIDRCIALGILPEPRGVKIPKLPTAEPRFLRRTDQGDFSINLLPSQGEEAAEPAEPFGSEEEGNEPELDAEGYESTGNRPGYCVKWPDMSALSDAEKAAIAEQRTRALTTYVGGQGEAIMAPLDFLTREMGYSEEEAMEILAATISHLELSNPETEDEIQPGHVPSPPKPEPEPGAPIKVREGERVISPDGAQIF